MSFLSPAPKIARLPASKIDGAYLKHRILNFAGIFLGYLCYYLLRNNVALATPYLAKYGFSKTQLGWVLSMSPAAYGLSKFLMGNLSDRSNPRYFLTLGLLISALAVFALGVVPGWATSTTVLGAVMLLNGCVQGMGAPPCYRTIAHWFPIRLRGRVVSVWSTSHNVGAGLIALFVASCIGANSKWHLFSWEAIFWFPGAFCVVMALFIMAIMVDTPQSVGLPSVEEYDAEYKTEAQQVEKEKAQQSSDDDEDERKMTGREIMFKYVLSSTTVWLLALANIFVYVIRYGLSNWAPLYLSSVDGPNLGHAFGATGLTIFEYSGIGGMLFCGYLSDRFFKNNKAILSMLCLMLVGVGIVCYHYATTIYLASAALILIGAFIYGPVMLVNLQGMNAVPKKAVGTTIGFLGLAGYWGGNISASALLGYVLEHFSWDGMFKVFYAACICSMVIFALISWISRNSRKKLKLEAGS